jgi:hypothetical protein
VTERWLPDGKEHSVLSDAEKAHLEEAIYPLALAEAGEPDTPRNRLIAASDYWQFLRLGGGTEAAATAAIVRGLRACDAG